MNLMPSIGKFARQLNCKGVPAEIVNKNPHYFDFGAKFMP